MTYLQYHLTFIVPLLALLSALTWKDTRAGQPFAGAFRPENAWSRRTFWLFPLIPMVYTTPWDNYLVFKGVWHYPPERVLARLGYVPVEEYAFFILQTLITGLWLFYLLRRGGSAKVAPEALLTRWLPGAAWLGVAFAGALMLRFEDTFYFGLILSWAAPVLSLLSFGFGDLVWGKARTFWLACLPPTLYLWATDYFAIHDGIWSISPRYTLGWNLGGTLPAEEMTFFLITNLLIVTGLLSFLHPASLQRLLGWTALLRLSVRPWMGLVLVYALLKIPVPLWPAGFALLGTLSTAALFGAGLWWAWDKVGARALLLAALAFGTGLGIEVLGSRSGVPFGRYSYEGAPGLRLLEVPLLVPLGWFAMTLAAGVLTSGRAWLAGLLLVAWDVGLEPLMTTQHFWTWSDSRALWAGAPVQNFISWWAVGAGLVWAFKKLAPQLFAPSASPQAAPGRLPADIRLAYIIEAAFLPAGLLLLGLPQAALATALCMGAALWLGLMLARRASP